MVVLAARLDTTPRALRVAAGRVFFLTDYAARAVGSVPTSGGPVTTLTTGSPHARAGAIDLAPDGLVELTAEGSLNLISFDGATRRRINAAASVGLAVRAPYAFTEAAYEIDRVTLADGALRSVTFDRLDPSYAMVATSGFLFAIWANVIERRTLDLALDVSYPIAQRALVIAAPHAIFFVVDVFPDGGEPFPEVYVWRDDERSPTKFSSVSSPSGYLGTLLAADDAGVYVAENGSIVRHDARDWSPQVIATGLSDPAALAIDARCYYIADANTIMRVPRE